MLPRMDVPQLTVGEAADALAGGAVAIDVRERDEWDAGHLEDSVHIPLSELGSRSDLAAHALARNGRTGSANLAGGLAAWVAEGRTLAPDGAGVVV